MRLRIGDATTDEKSGFVQVRKGHLPKEREKGGNERQVQTAHKSIDLLNSPLENIFVDYSTLHLRSE